MYKNRVYKHQRSGEGWAPTPLDFVSITKLTLGVLGEKICDHVIIYERILVFSFPFRGGIPSVADYFFPLAVCQNLIFAHLFLSFFHFCIYFNLLTSMFPLAFVFPPFFYIFLVFLFTLLFFLQ
jgi:hypothetical protein